MWILIVCSWMVCSLPLAVVVGKVLARSTTSDDRLSVDVDACLERIFAEADGQPA